MVKGVCGKSDEGRGFRPGEQGLQVRSQCQGVCKGRMGGLQVEAASESRSRRNN